MWARPPRRLDSCSGREVRRPSKTLETCLAQAVRAAEGWNDGPMPSLYLFDGSDLMENAIGNLRVIRRGMHTRAEGRRLVDDES